MKKRTASKTWFPFWVDKWIFGSMRIEFSLEERAIWVDFLAIASKDGGYIRANEDIAYPSEQLAGMLMIPVDKLKAAIESFIKKEKLKRLKNGTLLIVKWEKYQFTDRWKREIEKTPVSSEKKEERSPKVESILYNKTKQDKIKQDKNHLALNDKKPRSEQQKVYFDFEFKGWRNIKEEDLNIWAETYPACNIHEELLRMKDWLLSNPTKRKSNYRKFITNWLMKSQDKGGTMSKKKKMARMSYD